jgi:hypothetical protein
LPKIHRHDRIQTEGLIHTTLRILTSFEVLETDIAGRIVRPEGLRMRDRSFEYSVGERAREKKSQPRREAVVSRPARRMCRS